jgi:hypothetical protein
MSESHVFFDRSSARVLVQFWMRFVRFGLRITPVCVVSALPTLAIFDRFNPWRPAVNALSAYSGQRRVCVGVGGHHTRTSAGTYSSVERSFVLFPQVLTSPSIITVSVADGAPGVVTESRFAFWLVAAIYITALVLSARFVRVIGRAICTS